RLAVVGKLQVVARRARTDGPAHRDDVELARLVGRAPGRPPPEHEIVEARAALAGAAARGDHELDRRGATEPAVGRRTPGEGDVSLAKPMRLPVARAPVVAPGRPPHALAGRLGAPGLQG